MNEHDYCLAQFDNGQHQNEQPSNTIDDQYELPEARVDSNATSAEFENVTVKIEKPGSPVSCGENAGSSSVNGVSDSDCGSATSSTPGINASNIDQEADNLIQPALVKYDLSDDIGEYFFETDHLALRGNQDYLALLKTIAVLEAQRQKAIQDLDRLYEAQEEILRNPIEFVEKLQRREDLDLPNPQSLASLPNIDWDKYGVSLNPIDMRRHHMTRKKHQDQKKLLSEPPRVAVSESNSILSVTNQARNEIKSQTFNQPWTPEEQKRLEELLDIYPQEEVESRRWEKIARALGNRTRQQVASRVQKYFIKLTKAGMSVPGRTPNISNYVKKVRGSTHRHQRLNNIFQHSTFLASVTPPVFMPDNEDDTMSSCNFSSTSSVDGDTEKLEVFSDDESIPVELRDTAEYKELIMLQKLKTDINKSQNRGLAQHIGFKCDRCECEPIMGMRWHCTECPGVNFCSDCVDCMHETQTHRSNHQLEPIRSCVMSYIDNDYARFMPENCAYLDTTFKPST